ncbi:uncharacterized protein LOC134238965 [Saccostrea cucullata]|uniref:uncharacterized protein LOC134238965 n=1 Tax=Saccostrea cuccullata TaxID=36930 RepID=UPI002ED286A0
MAEAQLTFMDSLENNERKCKGPTLKELLQKPPLLPRMQMCKPKQQPPPIHQKQENVFSDQKENSFENFVGFEEEWKKLQRELDLPDLDVERRHLKRRMVEKTPVPPHPLHKELETLKDFEKKMRNNLDEINTIIVSGLNRIKKFLESMTTEDGKTILEKTWGNLKSQFEFFLVLEEGEERKFTTHTATSFARTFTPLMNMRKGRIIVVSSDDTFSRKRGDIFKEVNPGKNKKGQGKRGRCRSGKASTNYIDDDQKRNNSVFKRKNTLLKKAKELHSTTHCEILLVIKTPSGKVNTFTTSLFEEELRSLMDRSKGKPTPQPSSTPSSIHSKTISPCLFTTPLTTPSPTSTVVRTFDISSPPRSSISSPPATFPSPQPTLSTEITVRAEVHTPPPSKKPTPTPAIPLKRRRIDSLKNKSTQTEDIKTKIPDTCNICLRKEARGHWVGCDKARCGYWVHDHCVGFFFNSNIQIKKAKFKCPVHRN